MKEVCFLKHATTTTDRTNNKESLTTAYISKPGLAIRFDGTCLNCLNLEEILSPVYEKLEEQNNFLATSKIYYLLHYYYYYYYYKCIL